MAMSVIEVMSGTLASQVAAGEVIERPASVVKELVENAIDAGARRIEVEMKRGGAAFLRVRDDGIGMNAEDAARSLERHATSKLKRSDDLNAIATLGFRGEALPSIASVARFVLTTRQKECVEGTEVRVSGGEPEGDPKVVGCPVGTSVEVRDLFYNVPARRKFLKAETTEASHIEHQIRLHALCTPDIGWVLRKDGRVVFDLAPTNDRRVRIEAMSGADTRRHLIEIPRCERHGIEIEGALLPASHARRGRKHQFVFLNGRPVEDITISRALQEGFRGALPDGMHPTVWIWITMHPALVDVNVHPAKREVRFAEPAKVRVAILEAVEAALRPPEEAREVARVNPPPFARNEKVGREEVLPVISNEDQEPAPSPAKQGDTLWRHEEQAELPVEETEKQGGAPFMVIGTLSDRYALLEGEEGLVLFEPRAGKARIFYERLLGEGEGVDSQGLLVPVLMELDVRDVDLVMRHREHFDQAGFVLESFGGQTITISSAPSFLAGGDLRKALVELVDLVIDRDGGTRVKRLAFEGFAAHVAGVAARRDGWGISSLPGLLDELFACDLPYCDPSGKPTLVQISYQELDRKFGKS
ncbi:MAG: DNA mismatch repair endonuclease MutL [Akkermansiaceae bacterium]|jgi:DNA mismatch repair protein MutL